MRFPRPIQVIALLYLAALPKLSSLLAAPSINDELIKEALAAAADIKDLQEKSSTLQGIVYAQAHLHEFVAAQLTATTIDFKPERNAAWHAIAEEYAVSGDLEAASQLLNMFAGDAQSGIYRALAKGFAKKGDIAAAKKAAAHIIVPPYANDAAQYIALAQAAAGDSNAARDTLASITNDWGAMPGYAELIAFELKHNNEPEARKTMEAARAAAKETDASSQAYIAASEIRLGNPAAAALIPDRFPSPIDKTQILWQIFDAQVHTGDLAAAQKTAAQFPGIQLKIFAWEILAPALAPADPDEARRLLKESLEIYATIKDEPRRPRAALAIAHTIAQLDGIETAATWARTHTDPQIRAFALLGTLQALPEYHPAE